MYKYELINLLVEVLKKHPKGQFEFYVNEVTKLINIYKGISLSNGMPIPEDGIFLNNQEIELVQEIIWDLIIQRVVTPGADRVNNTWPFLRVTDVEKLNMIK